MRADHKMRVTSNGCKSATNAENPREGNQMRSMHDPAMWITAMILLCPVCAIAQGFTCPDNCANTRTLYINDSRCWDYGLVAIAPSGAADLAAQAWGYSQTSFQVAMQLNSNFRYSAVAANMGDHMTAHLAGHGLPATYCPIAGAQAAFEFYSDDKVGWPLVDASIEDQDLDGDTAQVNWITLNGKSSIWLCLTKLGFGSKLLDLVPGWCSQPIVFNDFCNASEFLGCYGTTPAGAMGWVGTVNGEFQGTALTDIYSKLGCIPMPIIGGGLRYCNAIEDAVHNYPMEVQYTTSKARYSMNYCQACANDAEAFVRAGAFADSVYWLTSADPATVEYRIEGRIGEGTYVPVATCPARYTSGHWANMYCVRMDQHDEVLRVVAVAGDGREVTSREFRSAKRPPDWDVLVSADYSYSHGEATKGGGGALPVVLTKRGVGDVSPPRDGVDVVIVARTDSMAAPVVEQMEAKQLRVQTIVVTGPENVALYYGDVVYLNALINSYWYGYEAYPVSPGPLMVIVGAQGGCAGCLGAAVLEYSDAGERCQQYPGCKSDYALTDWNSDDVPDGPVTRIPARLPAEVEMCIGYAEAFSSGSTVAPVRQVVLLSDDQTDNYMDNIREADAVYRSIGYVPRTAIRTSLVGEENRWSVFVGQMNEGAVEVFGRGRVSNANIWCNIVDTYPMTQLNDLTRAQVFVGWMPSCNTVDAVVNENGYFVDGRHYTYSPVVTSLMLPMDGSNPGSRMAGMVGHMSGGWNEQHDLYGHYLLMSRESAIPGVTDIATIAYNAAMAMIRDYPEFKAHVMSVGVIGAYARIPADAITNVGDAAMDVGVRVISSGDVAHIRMQMARAGRARVCVYDVRGRLVRDVFSGVSGPGDVEWRWAYDDGRGHLVASGVYVVRVVASDGRGSIAGGAKVTVVN